MAKIIVTAATPARTASTSEQLDGTKRSQNRLLENSLAASQFLILSDMHSSVQNNNCKSGKFGMDFINGRHIGTI
jgi:hypothetical protein